MRFSDMSVREMLQEIVDKKAPYNRDRVLMAINGFEQHSEYAKEIISRLENGCSLDVEESTKK